MGWNRSGHRGARRAFEGDQALGAQGLDTGIEFGKLRVLYGRVFFVAERLFYHLSAQV